MKKIITTICLSLFFISNKQLLANSGLNYPKGFNEQKNASISFLENKGQVYDQNNKARPDVLFSGVNQGMVFHLRNNGVSYQLTKLDSLQKESTSPITQKKDKLKNGIHNKFDLPVNTTSIIYRLDINWLYINENSRVTKGKAIEGYNNYYSENCPNGVLNVKTFEDITYLNIYKGIDLKWYQQNNQLKYDYIVSAGADYRQIQFEINGALDISINAKGDLELKTPLGTIIEQAPLVIQNGKTLPSSWIINKNIVSFDIQNVNPHQSFIIDPPVRVWGTYYGGNFHDYGNSCATDAAGNVYLTGITLSTNGTTIATFGSHQTTCSGTVDAFLVKFNSAGVRQWGTFYGGNGDDGGFSCCTDASSNVYMAGYTNSPAGIAVGGHSNVISGTDDAFLVKFNTAGVRQWATYYGSPNYDEGTSCATDPNGNVYLAGYTDDCGSGSIATVGAHQVACGGGSIYDAFLIKFNSAGVRQWGTYYGGTGFDIGISCCTDASSNVYMAGYTDSPAGIAIGGHSNVYSGNTDAFLVKFNTVGVRQWATYYGSPNYDEGISCATDPIGNVYLAGYTDDCGSGSIETVGAHQVACGGGSSYDAFLVKFNSAGVRQWGTYYGGTGGEVGYSCFTDASSNVYMAGETNSTGAIATPTGHQTVLAGSQDAFLVQFNSSGVRQWATYYGGSGFDIGFSGCVGAAGRIYLTGNTASTNTNVISTAGSHQVAKSGSSDAFLVQFYDNLIVLPVELIEFKGNIENKNVILNWTTQTETNNKLFEIERSVDGVNFVKIGIVAGAGNSQTILHYAFFDENVKAGVYYYYRLKQTDFNGAFKYSKLIALTLNEDFSQEIMIYPNPTNEVINVIPSNQITNIQVINNLGENIIEFKNLNGNNKCAIDLSALLPGHYILMISTYQGIFFKRVVKI
jgi:hypothetical protein